MQNNELYEVLVSELGWPPKIAEEYIEWLNSYNNILHR